ncbi:MAG: hypothetical protein J6578_03575 [Snodgrassella sp.]|uniref:type II restriction enzyme n=1 Tax=Snodgrassella TaxID=1193515 RepID=UPI0008162E50|nr:MULTISPECIES: transcriptional regulator [Snodgrassella]MCO6507856.1 hypothetical protein [Snodgrassella sp.]MCO6524721.1 hypothetical protein [Candidatus Schmidhempelia sp.]SCC05673.1 hypothetical protein GA0061082_10784 [Snodgrassella sp. R-53583]
MSKFKNLSISEAWCSLFEEHNILERIEGEGFFKIDAKEIKKIKEPRLMAKFDHFVNLPKIFSENHLAILPVTRGSYIIGNFQAYQSLEQVKADTPITRMYLPDYIQSLDLSNITSEAMALNCAFTSGIIADFLQENEIKPTVSGRAGSGAFDFFINLDKQGKNVCHSTQRIYVDKSQIEIDAGYEGNHSLALIEAKLDISKDFLIRQLYYPYRVWKKRIQKPVRPIFFIYSNGIYNFYEYEFQNFEYYNSLILIKHRKYTIEDTKIRFLDIEKVMRETSVLYDEPKVPFPQANTFERVINICELLVAKELSHSEITINYAFTKRQTGYYTNAAIYLGLVNKSPDEISYCLTEKGRSILEVGYKDRQLSFCKLILQHNVFNLVLKEYIENNRTMPSKSRIIEIMQKSNLYNIRSLDTFRRRASTVTKWIEWIVNLTK